MATRILWENRVADADSITPSVADTGYPGSNVAIWRDSAVWRASDDNQYEIEFDFGSQVTFSSLAIVAHNLNTVGARYKFDASNDEDSSAGRNWTNIVNWQTPANDKTLAKFFTQKTYKYGLLSVNTGGSSGDPNFTLEIGIIFIGDYLEMERHPALPTDPYAQQDKSTVQISQDGYFLGKIIEHSMRVIQFNYPVLTPTFMDGTFFPFFESHRNKPFVLVWDSVNHSDDAWLVRLDTKNSKFPFINGLYQSVVMRMSGRLEE